MKWNCQSDFWDKLGFVGVFWSFFILSLLIYFNTLHNEFVWDDLHIIVNNSHLSSWQYVPGYFSESLTEGSSGSDAGYYRPLLLLTHFLSYQLTGLDPYAHHFQNILWHALAGLAGYYFFYLFTQKKGVAFLAGLIFIVHPLQTEAISYIAGRGDPVYAFFIFLCLGFLLKLLKEKINGWVVYRNKFFWLSLLFFLLALLSRERALLVLVLVPLLFVSEQFVVNRRELMSKLKKDLLIFIPFILLFFGYFIYRAVAFSDEPTSESAYQNYNISFSGQPKDLEESDNFSQSFIQSKILMKGFFVYHRLLFWPNTLVMDRTVTLEGGWDWQVFAGVLILFVEVSALIWFFLGRKRNEFFALGFFLSTLLPTFYVFLKQGILYEHWLYLPMFGFWVLFFIFLERFFCEKVFWLGLLLMVLIFSWRVIERNKDWKNEIVFFEKNINNGGGSYRVLHNLALAYERQGNLVKAEEYFLKVLDLRNDSFLTMFNLAEISFKKGDLTETRYWLERALLVNPNFDKARQILKLLDNSD